MMKNLLIVSALAFLLVSCGAETKTTETVENNDVEIINEVEMLMEETGLEEAMEEGNAQVVMEEQMIEESENMEVSEEVLNNEEYYDLTSFINTELSDEQKSELAEILEQRTARQLEIQTMLEESVDAWNIEEVLEQVKAIRSTCASRILPYVASNKVEDFTAYCEAGNDTLKEKYSK